MRAAIYNPYLDTLGGGERYSLTFAKVLSDNGWEVDVEWKDSSIVNKLEERFGIDLKKINFVDDIHRGDGYDLCFWVSDGSIPLLRSRKNILHFQVPFKNVNGRSLMNKMKMIRINKVICNSQFTKDIIDSEFGIKSLVVYPPVSVDQIKPMHKDNIILYVGRFSRMLQNKRQDILIESFKKIFDNGITDWKLILAGGIEVGVGDYINELKSVSNGYPVEIVESPSFSELVKLYGSARIFWSASGYDTDELKNPEGVEHFGMTVVEAMAGGAVPVIFNAGGHKEIISDNTEGFIWKNTDELVEKTKLLIDDKIFCRKLALRCIKSSKKFGYNRFKEKCESLILQ